MKTFEVGMDFNKLLEIITNIMKEMLAHSKQYETEAYSVPSAPNSGTFRSNRYGGIYFCENQIVHGDYYGVTRIFTPYFKIGGAIKYEIHTFLYHQFLDKLSLAIYADLPAEAFWIQCGDGNKILIMRTDGSAWAGFGAVVYGK